jgi:WhiB family redox-sensing transcriptional regulator
VNSRDRFEAIAARLDRLRPVPTGVLGAQVMREGRCIKGFVDGDVPELSSEGTPDRELAARLCAECPVQEQCLTFELRTAGPGSAGVLGALPEEDRWVLYPIWRARQGWAGGEGR